VTKPILNYIWYLPRLVLELEKDKEMAVQNELGPDATYGSRFFLTPFLLMCANDGVVMWYCEGTIMKIRRGNT